MDGLDVLASVAWARDGERGIVFDSPLNTDALICLEEHAVATKLALR
jgi:hypothetical protein